MRLGWTRQHRGWKLTWASLVIVVTSFSFSLSVDASLRAKILIILKASFEKKAPLRLFYLRGLHCPGVFRARHFSWRHIMFSFRFQAALSWTTQFLAVFCHFLKLQIYKNNERNKTKTKSLLFCLNWLFTFVFWFFTF